jgi:hypothetical protein
MMSSVYPSVVRSQLKLYLFPDESLYSIKCFIRLGPIEVEGAEVYVMEGLWMTRISINTTSSQSTGKDTQSIKLPGSPSLTLQDPKS